MAKSNDRLRPPPAARLAGLERRLDFAAALSELRSEQRATHDGHRQVTVVHDEHLRLILFAFDRGGRLPAHRAPGTVVIHALRGSLRVRTSATTHDVPTGSALVLAADVTHEVEAVDQADMLLTVAFAGTTRSEGRPRIAGRTE